MRFLVWVAKGALFLALAGFALKNSEIVTLRYFLGQEWRAPLSLVLLLFFAAGAVLGVLAALSVAYRQRRELNALRRAAASRAAARGARQPDAELL
jgi:uncharacterized integral membrane protein